MKFIAPDLKAAKAKARRAIGNNMVVLSVRDLPSGDIELSAADRPEPPVSDPLSNPSNSTHQSRNFGTGFDGEETRAPRRRRNSSGARLNEPLEQKFGENNLSNLSNKLVSRSRKQPKLDLSDPGVGGIVDILRPHSIDSDLISALLNAARGAGIDDDLYSLEHALREVFSFNPIDTALAAPIMLVGPTGAGKTSCSAKLASAAINNGTGAFMMTADVGRAGAIEQLQTYGKALGAEYYIVETPLDVSQALKSKPANGFVIFDTPGISPFDPGDFAALRSYQDAAGAEPVLVLPASGDPEEYKDWATSFAEFGVRRMIITKFDATKRVGAGLTAAYEAGLSLANFSESPFISEGLITASPEFLGRRLMSAGPGQMGR